MYAPSERGGCICGGNTCTSSLCCSWVSWSVGTWIVTVGLATITSEAGVESVETAPSAERARSTVAHERSYTNAPGPHASLARRKRSSSASTRNPPRASAPRASARPLVSLDVSRQSTTLFANPLRFKRHTAREWTHESTDNTHSVTLLLCVYLRAAAQIALIRRHGSLR